MMFVSPLGTTSGELTPMVIAGEQGIAGGRYAVD